MLIAIAVVSVICQNPVVVFFSLFLVRVTGAFLAVCCLFTGLGSVYNVTTWPAGNSCGTYLLRGTAAMAPPPSKEGAGDMQALHITINSHPANGTNTTGNLIVVNPHARACEASRPLVPDCKCLICLCSGVLCYSTPPAPTSPTSPPQPCTAWSGGREA